MGGSGASGTNTINTTVDASIGDYTNVTTNNLDVTATSTTLKNMSIPNAWSTWDVQAGSGGVIAGSAAQSMTNISNDTEATIGNSVTIDVVGSLSDPGAFVVSAYNDVEASDWVDLDAGGADRLCRRDERDTCRTIP